MHLPSHEDVEVLPVVVHGLRPELEPDLALVAARHGGAPRRRVGLAGQDAGGEGPPSLGGAAPGGAVAPGEGGELGVRVLAQGGDVVLASASMVRNILTA